MDYVQEEVLVAHERAGGLMPPQLQQVCAPLADHHGGVLPVVVAQDAVLAETLA
jgi:hypothetical protein